MAFDDIPEDRADLHGECKRALGEAQNRLAEGGETIAGLKQRIMEMEAETKENEKVFLAQGAACGDLRMEVSRWEREAEGNIKAAGRFGVHAREGLMVGLALTVAKLVHEVERKK